TRAVRRGNSILLHQRRRNRNVGGRPRNRFSSNTTEHADNLHGRREGVPSSGSVVKKLFRDEEFGIAVSAPTGALLCPTLENEHDHGPIFILGPAQAKACDDVEGNRTIVVFAGYNAAEVSKRLDDFLKWICANVANGRCRPAPSGLQITGLPSKAARVNHSDGWIDIIV